MKQIINECLQALQVCLVTPEGNKMYRLEPRQSVVVPASYLSKMIKNLQRRRMVKVSDYR
jgi:hypothetical protein